MEKREKKIDTLIKTKQNKNMTNKEKKKINQGKP